jgi:hypothetical protein
LEIRQPKKLVEGNFLFDLMTLYFQFAQDIRADLIGFSKLKDQKELADHTLSSAIELTRDTTYGGFEKTFDKKYGKIKL